jgi:hypothetical protein
MNRIGCVVVSVLASSVVDREFENNVSEWSDMSTRGLLFQ